MVKNGWLMTDEREESENERVGFETRKASRESLSRLPLNIWRFRTRFSLFPLWFACNLRRKTYWEGLKKDRTHSTHTEKRGSSLLLLLLLLLLQFCLNASLLWNQSRMLREILSLLQCSLCRETRYSNIASPIISFSANSLIPSPHPSFSLLIDTYSQI